MLTISSSLKLSFCVKMEKLVSSPVKINYFAALISQVYISLTVPMAAPKPPPLGIVTPPTLVFPLPTY